FVLATDLIMTNQEELEKVQHQPIFQYLSMNLLTTTQLKLDN
ncbi:uncharacterized protein METZ01_LOCUS496079, partial [marine metagenome]